MYMYKYIYETQLLHSFHQTFENSIDVLLILLLIFNHWRTYVFMRGSLALEVWEGGGGDRVPTVRVCLPGAGRQTSKSRGMRW